ncbi:hypothetical protein OZ411_15345 [Bradyrhizobium sp. Arg237L]|uniref:hypothetical protein n=1 Tax=Bradyrhizobium sp. Arg237L TaxID=3003352 RepID=UPI00249DC11A|nr:hypothetical protein [Bradyrhizobium sp. Arg237L]MDI4234185.1 hypothetical protein [Bradyrhizobium sp. Arg237L]
MVGIRSGATRLDRLYGFLTDNSKAGGVRKVWREHLGIGEAELRLLARTPAFGEATDTFDGLRDQLDLLLPTSACATFRPIGARFPATTSSSNGWRRGDSSSIERVSARPARGKICSDRPRAARRTASIPHA